MSWNVNGIRAVLKKGFSDFLTSYDPDILCLQETKAQQGQVPVDFPEYEEFWHSAKKLGYSGTAIFTKQKPISVVFGFDSDILKKNHTIDAQQRNANEEGRLITAEFDSFYVVNVYTPNTKDDLSRLAFRYTQWDPLFLTYLKKLEEKKPVIFCGDLNVAHQEIDLARPKANEGKNGFTKEEREGFTNLMQAGFIDTFRHLHPTTTDAYTWWSFRAGARKRNVGWRIDYVGVSHTLKNQIKKAKIHPEVEGSDHCPISLVITI